MNRKEINAMTDEELCVKAAEISGWKPPTGEFDWVPNHTMQYDPGGWCYYTIHDDLTERKIPSGEFASFYFWHTDDGQARTDGPPKYTNNWTDASQLLDYMENIGLETIMVNCHDGNLKAVRVVRGVAAPFAPMETLDNPTYFSLKYAIANVQDEKMPRAITKAFIMAMGDNSDE